MDWSDRRMMYQSGNQLWHSDSSFKPVPATASLLSARELPSAGGETEFASMRHAWETLPESTRHHRQRAVRSEHEQALPLVRQALVRANPVNGRKSIYIGSHAWYIEGRPDDESRRPLDDLLEHTTRPACVYRHRWTVDDLVMWDNRCVLHRGRPWDSARHRRVMHRTTVAGEGPTVEPPLAAHTDVWEGIIPTGVGV